MARGFRQLEARRYPRRQWALCGHPDSGKSTFAARMAGDQAALVIDADQRFDTVARLAQGILYTSDDPKENVLIPEIVANLHAAMPADMPDVKLIIVDSLTAIIAPLVAGAVMGNQRGQFQNRSAAYIDKAVAMRVMQDAITRWGTDVLWVYHLQDGRDKNGQPHTITTIPPTELARLQRSLNANLRVVFGKKGKRGIFVEWARAGRAGMTLWDDSGSWEGMPEALEAAMYDNVQPAEVLPASFSGPDEAMAWAVKRGAYSQLEAAKDGYSRVKGDNSPQNAAEMWALWVNHVGAVLAAANAGSVPADGF